MWHEIGIVIGISFQIKCHIQVEVLAIHIRAVYCVISNDLEVTKRIFERHTIRFSNLHVLFGSSTFVVLQITRDYTYYLTIAQFNEKPTPSYLQSESPRGQVSKLGSHQKIISQTALIQASTWEDHASGLICEETQCVTTCSPR